MKFGKERGRFIPSRYLVKLLILLRWQRCGKVIRFLFSMEFLHLDCNSSWRRCCGSKSLWTRIERNLLISVTLVSKLEILLGIIVVHLPK